MTALYLSVVLASVAVATLAPRRFVQPEVIELLIHILAGLSFGHLVGVRRGARAHGLKLGILLFTWLVVQFLTEWLILVLSGRPTFTVRALLRQLEAVLICWVIADNVSLSLARRFERRLLVLLSMGFALSTLYALLGSQLSTFIGSVRVLSSGKYVRATSPLGGPNIVGFIAAVSLPYYLTYTERDPKASILPLGFAVAALILSGSKTAFVAGLVGMAVRYITKQLASNGQPRVRIRMTRLVAQTLGAAIAVYFVANTRLIQLLTPLSALEEGGSQRIAVWSQALDLVNQRPWGWGTEFFLSDYGGPAPFAAHNLWLQLILDYGWVRGVLVGAAAMMVGALMLREGYLSRRTCGGALSGSTAALLVASMGDYVFWEPRVLIVLAAVVGGGLLWTRSEALSSPLTRVEKEAQ